MMRHAAAWLAWALLAVSLTALAVTAVRSPFAPDDGSLFLAPLLAFAVVGAVVAARRPDHAIGWLFSAIGLALAGAGFLGSMQALVIALDPAWRLALFTLAALSWYLGLGLTLTFALLLFPTGRLPSRRWRPVAWLAILGIGWMGLGDQIEMTRAGEPTLFSILGLADLDHAALMHVATAGVVVVAIAALGSAASLFVRFRHANGQEGQQLKWFAAAAALVVVLGVVVFIVESLPDVAETPIALALEDVIWPLSIATIPIAAGMAVLRYRLYDIDLIIRRTAVYGALTAALAAIYLSSVVMVQGIVRALSGQEADIAIVAATLAVAAVFQPLRRRIQAFIDRRFYRRRYDAALVLAAHRAALRDEIDVEHLTAALVRAADETMRPAHLSLWLRQEDGGDGGAARPSAGGGS